MFGGARRFLGSEKKEGGEGKGQLDLSSRRRCVELTDSSPLLDI